MVIGVIGSPSCVTVRDRKLGGNTHSNDRWIEPKTVASAVSLDIANKKMPDDALYWQMCLEVIAQHFRKIISAMRFKLSGCY